MTKRDFRSAAFFVAFYAANVLFAYGNGWRFWASLAMNLGVFVYFVAIAAHEMGAVKARNQFVDQWNRAVEQMSQQQGVGPEIPPDETAN